MEAKKATDDSQTVGAAATAPAPVKEQAAEQTVDAACAPLGEFTANHLNRLIRSKHPKIKLELREVEVLEVMPDARLKVQPVNATDPEEHFYVNLDATLFDQLLSTLTS